MVSHFFVVACIQALCSQYAFAQPINCGCTNQVAVTETTTCVQNPGGVLVNQPANIIAQPSIIAQPGYLTASPCEVEYINQYAVPAMQGTTIIQDGSVANNLANALQLLIVSNLLSNTLPCNDLINLGVAQPALQLAQPPLQLAQPALQVAQPIQFAQPGLQLLQPGLQIAQPALQLAQPGLPLGCGFGCGCGCGCGGLNYVI